MMHNSTINLKSVQFRFVGFDFKCCPRLLALWQMVSTSSSSCQAEICQGLNLFGPQQKEGKRKSRQKENCFVKLFLFRARHWQPLVESKLKRNSLKGSLNLMTVIQNQLIVLIKYFPFLKHCKGNSIWYLCWPVCFQPEKGSKRPIRHKTKISLTKDNIKLVYTCTSHCHS